MVRCASQSGASSGSAAPSNTSGTTTRLTSGIAMALAIGETSETCWNSPSSSGVRPMAIAHCTLAYSTSQWLRPMRCAVTYRISATAPNDSQKPTEITAHGSGINTPSSAMLSICPSEKLRFIHSAAATAPTMYTVRCAGTAKPDNNA